MCAFGDSVMKGIVADKDNSAGRGLKYRISEMGFAERCRRNLNIEVENFARFGEKLNDEMRKNQGSRAKSHKKRIMFQITSYTILHTLFKF